MAVIGGRAVAYRRVSTSEQAESGLGLEAQQTAIATASARLGLSLVETFTDAGVSGGVPLEGRPNLVAAIDALASGDTLVIARRDRLGRDVLHVSMIQRLVERRGARIVSAAGEGSDDDSPTSVLMRQIIDAFAEYERALIRARTKAAMAAARARGQRVGCIPWGMSLGDDGRQLVPNIEERAVLAEIRQLRARGFAIVSICGELNSRGLRNRQGRPFGTSFIAQLLDRHP